MSHVHRQQRSLISVLFMQKPDLKSEIRHRMPRAYVLPMLLYLIFLTWRPIIPECTGLIFTKFSG